MKVDFIFLLFSLATVCVVSGAETCSGIGGTCGSITSCTGIIVRNLCSGISPVCCVKVPGVSKAEEHLNFVEGFLFLKGYVPTDGSGVTIASGYDIGHGPDISGCVGSTIWNLLKPFRGLKTKADIVGAGYNPNNLPLTVSFQDGLKIDQCVIEKDKIIADKCSTKTSNCGSAVLISLAHWCGEGGLINGSGTKCAGKKKGDDYMKQFCANKKGNNDAALLTALKELLAAHINYGYLGNYRVTRVQQEIDFLKTC